MFILVVRRSLKYEPTLGTWLESTLSIIILVLSVVYIEDL